MVETVFTNPLFIETVLPFLLIFTIIFAILQKTKILGDNKRGIDLIVSLAIGLMFVAFGNATDIIVRMIPVLGIALVTILVFMLLLGFLYQPGDFELHKGIKVAIGVLIAIAVITTVLVLTGGLDYVTNFFYGDTSGLILNGILILLIIAAIAVVVAPGKSSGGKDK